MSERKGRDRARVREEGCVGVQKLKEEKEGERKERTEEMALNKVAGIT